MIVFQSGHCFIRRSTGYKVVIGPWLFLIMIHDLSILGNNFNIWKYVDGTTVYEVVNKNVCSLAQLSASLLTKYTTGLRVTCSGWTVTNLKNSWSIYLHCYYDATTEYSIRWPIRATPSAQKHAKVFLRRNTAVLRRNMRLLRRNKRLLRGNRCLLPGNLKHTPPPIAPLKFLMLLVPGGEIRLEYCFHIVLVKSCHL